MPGRPDATAGPPLRTTSQVIVDVGRPSRRAITRYRTVVEIRSPTAQPPDGLCSVTSWMPASGVASISFE
ncbi:hypothetical protein ILP97_19470 [Amycolatopsis sp. H6(2020)]|nr:hypothetical protein [Amycolatopsis sp. H6(2020)]